MTTNWREHAACKGSDLSVFFPDGRGVELATNPAAAALCRGCPVRHECLESELEKGGQQFGWFGGKSPAEREQIIRQRRRAAA